jgi:hypothetical protein
MRGWKMIERSRKEVGIDETEVDIQDRGLVETRSLKACRDAVLGNDCPCK